LAYTGIHNKQKIFLILAIFKEEIFLSVKLSFPSDPSRHFDENCRRYFPITNFCTCEYTSNI